MANPTLADCRASVLAKGYDVTPDIQDSAINAAIREVLAARRWPFLDSAGTAGNFTISPAALDMLLSALTGTALHPDRITLTDSTGTLVPLQWQPLTDWLDARAVDNTAGTPRYWSRLNDTVVFYPKPDATYTGTAYFSLGKADLVNPSDQTVIPGEYIDCVIWGAVATLAFRQRDYAAVDRAEVKRDDAVRRMARAYGIEQRQGGRQVRDTGFWDNM